MTSSYLFESGCEERKNEEKKWEVRRKSEWEREADCGMSTIAMKTLQHVKMIDVNVKFQDNYYFTWHDNPLLALYLFIFCT